MHTHARQYRGVLVLGLPVVVLLDDPSTWQVLLNEPQAAGYRFHAWAPGVSAPVCEHPELVVRCMPSTSTATAADLAAVLAFSGVTPAQILPSPGSQGAWDVACASEVQARVIMTVHHRPATAGTESSSSPPNGPPAATWQCTRGDGPLLPMAELPGFFVQPQGKVVFIEETDKSRVFAGTLRKHSKSHGIFASKDHRVPRILIPIEECPEEFATQAQKYADTLFVCRITSWPLHSVYRGCTTYERWTLL